MGKWGKHWNLPLAAALLGLCAGCSAGVSHNPIRFPYLFSKPGDIVQTHAKPTGGAYYVDFDPHAVKIEVRPIESTDPVRAEAVVIATVYDEKGVPRRNRRLEWILEGAGNIVEVDESGHYPGRGYKVDNKYGVSYTNYNEHRVTRGNADPNDDFTLRPGQSWCVISSAVEGDTFLTIYAPEIANWDARKVVITKHWVDAEWSFPPPAVNRAGTEHVLVTSVFRKSDRKPLANYRVRYTILDGPPAVFLPGRGQEAIVSSDLSGHASASLTQLLPQAGINRIGIEIIRPPDSPTGVGLVIGKGETTKEWQGPQVTLEINAPPTATVGQEISLSASVTNNSSVETQAMTVRMPLPEGVQLLRSEPRAIVENSQLIWTFGVLPPGRAHLLQLVAQASRPGPVSFTCFVTTVEGIRDEKTVTVQVAAGQVAPPVLPPDRGGTPGGNVLPPQPGGSVLPPGQGGSVLPPQQGGGAQPPPGQSGGAQAPSRGQAQLRLSVSDPLSALVGVPVTYQINVTNTGNAPATNVQLSAAFDRELEHDQRTNVIELKLDTIVAGDTKANLPLMLTPRKAGQYTIRITVEGDAGLKDEVTRTLVVQSAAAPKLTITKSGPKARFVDKNATWEIRINNAGDAPMNNVVVRDPLPRELVFLSASDAGKLINGEVIWNLGTIGPRDTKVITLTARCARLAQRLINVAIATADPNLQESAEAVLEVLGVPGYLLDISKAGDPVPVGGKVSYRITVTNTGSLPGSQVEISALLPPQLRLASTDPKAADPGNDPGRVRFPAVETLLPGQSQIYLIEAQALQAGDVRVKFELRKAPLADPPVVKEESTNIYVAPNGPGNPAPLPPPR